MKRATDADAVPRPARSTVWCSIKIVMGREKVKMFVDEENRLLVGFTKNHRRFENCYLNMFFVILDMSAT